jgi:exocyst complex protein 7
MVLIVPLLFNCRPLIENSKAPGKYVKHTPEQLELFLGNLFEGKQERT